MPSAGKNNIAYLQTDQFYKALQEYAEASGKDFSNVVNLKMRDAAFKANKAAPKASTGAIQQKWGKASADAQRIVSSSLSHKPLKLVYRRNSKGKAKKNASGKSVASRKYARKAYVHYTIQEARAYAAAIRKRRIRAISFVKAFFLALAQAIESACPEVGKMSTATKTGFDMSYVKATPEYPIGSGAISYSYKRFKGATARADMLIAAAWDKGLAATIADMQKYIERKLSERAKQHSV